MGLQRGMRPPPERNLRMRWALTWKDDEDSPDGRKAKARIVILGFKIQIYMIDRRQHRR